jgi:hypothetical protein
MKSKIKLKITRLKKDLLIVICRYIKAAKSFFNREKKCRRGRLWPRRYNFEEVKDFMAKVCTTFFVQPKICNYYKTNEQNLRCFSNKSVMAFKNFSFSPLFIREAIYISMQKIMFNITRQYHNIVDKHIVK